MPFDIEQLDASFHLDSLGRRLLLKEPLEQPSWGKEEKRNLARCMLGQLPEARIHQAGLRLEDALFRLTGTRSCLTTGAGREAIKLALMAMQAREGERVILPSFCCLSVLMPVLELGLKPVFADSGEDWQIDPESVRRVIRPGDRALIVPHLFGRLADINTLREIARQNGAVVIDDAAQAIGLEGDWGPAGTGGDVGVFSFGLFKPVSGVGGGVLMTDDSELFARARAIKTEASCEVYDRKRLVKICAKTLFRRYTYRLFLERRQRLQDSLDQEPFSLPLDRSVRAISPLSALLAASQIEKIHETKKYLCEKAFALHESFSQIPFFRAPSTGYAGSPRWVMELVPEYDTGMFYRQLFSYLIGCGIEVQPTYRPLHLYIRAMGLMPQGEFSRSEQLSRRLICFPFSKSTDIDHVTRSLRNFSSSSATGLAFSSAQIIKK